MKGIFASVFIAGLGIMLLSIVSDKFGRIGIGLRPIGLFFAAGGSVVALLCIATGRFG
ncbi:MAG: hypothetical protein ACJARS_004399, partial [bacterium]